MCNLETFFLRNLKCKWSLTWFTSFILSSKSQNFKNHKAQMKFINSYTSHMLKNISQSLLLPGKSKQREQSFNYCCSKSLWLWKWLKYDLIFAWLFSYKDSNFWYFSCICKVKKKNAPRKYPEISSFQWV